MNAMKTKITAGGARLLQQARLRGSGFKVRSWDVHVFAGSKACRPGRLPEGSRVHSSTLVSCLGFIWGLRVWGFTHKQKQKQQGTTSQACSSLGAFLRGVHPKLGGAHPQSTLSPSVRRAPKYEPLLCMVYLRTVQQGTQTQSP